MYEIYKTPFFFDYNSSLHTLKGNDEEGIVYCDDFILFLRRFSVWEQIFLPLCRHVFNKCNIFIYIPPGYDKDNVNEQLISFRDLGDDIIANREMFKRLNCQVPDEGSIGVREHIKHFMILYKRFLPDSVPSSPVFYIPTNDPNNIINVEIINSVLSGLQESIKFVPCSGIQGLD